MKIYHYKICLIYLFLFGVGVFWSLSVAAMTTSNCDTDSLITNGVVTKLQSDPVTTHSGISVSTLKGVVTLSGNVSTNQEVYAAVKNAESMGGVVDVQSKLFVMGSLQPLADSIITAKIKGIYIRENLIARHEVSITDIHVETKNGVVYLSGRAIREQVANAIRLARAVHGVVFVVSRVKVIG